MLIERIISSVRRRVRQLEIEMRIIETQLGFITKIMGFDINEANVLSLEHTIDVILHKHYCEYLHLFSERAKTRHSQKQLVEVHLECIKQLPLTSFMEEVFGHQCAIQTLTGISIETAGETPEKILKTVSNMLPFNLIIPILHDEKFLDVLFRTVSTYKPSEHKKALLSLWNPLMNLKLDKYIIVALAEIFLGFFVEEQVEESFEDMNEVYWYVTNSRLLISKGLSVFGLPPHAAELKVNHEVEVEEKPLFSLSEWKEEFPGTIHKEMKALVPGLKHVALELMKCQTQISVSTAVYKLWRAFDWLNLALSQEGDMAGADESFIFFVIQLCEADLTRLPLIVRAMEKFIIEEFKTSKVSYLLTQTRIALDWIGERKPAELKQVVLLPMKSFGQTQAMSKQRIMLNGFKLYTVPLFREAEMRPFPYFTAREEDVVVLYEYEMCVKDEVLKDYRFLQTPQGYLMVLGSDRIREWSMIEVVGGFYDVSVPMIETVSNLMVFLPLKLSDPRTSPLTKAVTLYSDTWGVAPSDVDRDMQERVLAMKQALIRYGAMTTEEDGTISGIVDYQMVQAVNKTFRYFQNDADFFVNKKIYDSVVSLKKSIFKFW